MRFSPHFHEDEFVFSQVQTRLRIDNTLTHAARNNLIDLCINVLEPIRSFFKPIVITSGYRCAALNAAVDGAANSAHTTGRAADFVVPGWPTLRLAHAICKLPDLPFDKLIFEGNWIHITHFGAVANKRQVLTAKFLPGRVQYTEGLPADV